MEGELPPSAGMAKTHNFIFMGTTPDAYSSKQTVCELPIVKLP